MPPACAPLENSPLLIVIGTSTSASGQTNIRRSAFLSITEASFPAGLSRHDSLF